MIDWAQFHFIRPYWLWALLVVVAILWIGIRQPVMNSAWRDAIDSHLLPYLLLGRQSRQRYVPVVLLATAVTIVVVSLAGPAWSRLPQAVYQTDMTRMVLLDLSRSMDAADIKPSRLERARFKTLDLLDKITEGQVGLIVFAHEPYVVSPLTEDSATVAAMVPALETQLMPKQGSRLQAALEKAGELFTQSAVSQGDIIVITDGLNDSSAIDTASELRRKGHTVSVLGVGTRQGAPIPGPGGGFVKNASGEIVISALNTTILRDLVSAGGGVFTTLAVGDEDIERILSLAQVRRKQNAQSDVSQTTEIWQDQGVWLVFILLPLALLAFRREALLLLVFIAAIPVSEPSYALDWDDLWLNDNQQAARVMQQGDFKQAMEKFSQPDWKGAASYRAGEYETAAREFSGSEDMRNQYNLGNALARAGKLQEALSVYEQVLKQDAGHEDAKFNKSLVERLMQQNKQEQKPSSPQSQEGDQDRKGDKSSQSSQNNQDSGNDQKSDAGQQKNQQQAQQQQDSDNSEQGDEKQGARQNDPKQSSRPDPANEARDTQELNKQKQAKARQRMDQENGSTEKQQATEQWLSRIKDDPGGLLRQKFIRQHQRRRERGESFDASEGERW